MKAISDEGTPALREMLREKGFTEPHARGVELWKMFKQAHDAMKAIAVEIDFNEREGKWT